MIVKSAGVWRVQVSATVANPGEVVVQVPPTAPTPIRVGLAAGHGRLDTVFGRLPEGATVVGDTVELRGPVLPGDQGQSLQLEYYLRAHGRRARDRDPGAQPRPTTSPCTCRTSGSTWTRASCTRRGPRARTT